MDSPEPMSILILGPMGAPKRPRGARDTTIGPSPGTLALERLVRQIADHIQADPAHPGIRFNTDTPDRRQNAMIVEGVLDKIEAADLCIIDLTDSRPAVAYESGIVHALGLPYIFVCQKDSKNFYFQQTEIISPLDTTQSFDPLSPTHSRLREKLVQFATDRNAPAQFANNEVTKYFHLPILDISGPSGLATGYFINALRRFVRRGGFFDQGACKLSREPSPGGARITAEMPVGHFVAVRPPDLATSGYPADNRALEQRIRDLGFEVVSATLQRLADELPEIRDYAGKFLARKNESGELALVNPAVIIEIPTTLYALRLAPRLRLLDDRLGLGPNDPARLALKQRKLDAMLTRFMDVLHSQMTREDTPTLLRQFRYVTFAELPDTIAAVTRGS